jgi:hypothetical protein
MIDICLKIIILKIDKKAKKLAIKNHRNDGKSLVLR